MELNDNSDCNLTENTVKLMKFPYKLWLITNSQRNNAIKWNHEDRKFLINTTLLGTYLCSNETIFKVKNISEFIKKLLSFGFVRCDNQNLESIVSNLFEENFPRDENSLYEIYKHDNFQKNHFELLEKIKKIDKLEKDYDDILPIIREINQYKRRKLFPTQQSNDNNNNDITDPCCSNKIEKLSNIEKPRLSLKTLIQVELNQYILNQRVYECDQNTTLTQNESAVIQLPAEVFENASESVSGFVEKTDYAGFYGSTMNFDKIRDFFAEYLPVYVHSNGDDEIMNANRIDNNGDIDGFRSASIDFENSGTSYPENLEDSEYISTLNYSTVPLYPKAATLEPIFATEENDGDEEMPNNSNDPNNEEDITMDEYLKFNKNDETTNNSQQQQQQQISNNQETKENITNNIKIEDEKLENNINNNNNEEDINQKNNEESFKIFFNQYRDSMNVLYET